jgi:hypothetical protein
MEGISRILPCGSLLVKEFPKQRNGVCVYEGRKSGRTSPDAVYQMR